MSDNADMLPWLSEPIKGVYERLQSGRLHHALLLDAPVGIGLRTFVDAIAALLLCESPSTAGACAGCKSCQLVRAGTHPDMMLVEPADGKRQIAVERIRELSGFVARTASVATRKVVLLDPADAMNLSSANSLLKSLEEPSAGTHLLLVTHSSGRLLPTIRSRCEQYRLPMPTYQVALNWLQGQVQPGHEKELLDAASGCPLAAIELERQGGLELMQSVASAFEQCSRPGSFVSPVVGSFGSHDLRELLNLMALVLLDFQRGELSGDHECCRLQFNRDIYRKIAGIASPDHLARTIAAIQHATRDAASTANPNGALLLEAILIDWQSGCSGKNRR